MLNLHFTKTIEDCSKQKFNQKCKKLIKNHSLEKNKINIQKLT